MGFRGSLVRIWPSRLGKGRFGKQLAGAVFLVTPHPRRRLILSAKVTRLAYDFTMASLQLYGRSNLLMSLVAAGMLFNIGVQNRRRLLHPMTRVVGRGSLY